MYRFGEPQPSYWEATGGDLLPYAEPLEGDAKCEVAVIGGGYTGLSAAYHLCRDYQVDVRVLEAGHIGWGASGRNGGFCSMGGTSLGIGGLIRKFGIEHTREYYQAQVDAVELVRNIIAVEKIATPVQGDSELAVACSPGAFAKMKAAAELQFRAIGLDVSVMTSEQVKEQYFDLPVAHGLVREKPTFGLHPLRYLRGFADAAVRHGAILHNRSQVTGWTKEGEHHILRTSQGSLRARYVIVAANGFMPENLHSGFAGKPLPLISSIVVTRPLSDTELDAHAWRTGCPVYTDLNLLDYFRMLPDKRLLLGGRGSYDGSEGKSEANFARLKVRLGSLFPHWRDIEIDYRWHGLVCLTRRLTPAVGRLPDDPSTFFAFGYHGNGVNNSTWCGKLLADWLAQTGRDDARTPKALPYVMSGMPPGFPIPSLRLFYIQARILGLRFEDWWHNRK